MKDYLFSFLIHWGPSHDSTCVLFSSCDFPRELRRNQLTSALLMRQVHWHTLGCCSNFAIVVPKLLFSYFCHKSVTTYRPRLVCRPWNVCSGCYLLLNPHSAWYPEVERRTYQRPYLWHHCLHKPDRIFISNYNILLDFPLTYLSNAPSLSHLTCLDYNPSSHHLTRTASGSSCLLFLLSRSISIHSAKSSHSNLLKVYIELVSHLLKVFGGLLC